MTFPDIDHRRRSPRRLPKICARTEFGQRLLSTSGGTRTGEGIERGRSRRHGSLRARGRRPGGWLGSGVLLLRVQLECDVRVERLQEVGGVEDLAGGGDADGLGAAGQDALEGLGDEGRGDGVDVLAAGRGPALGPAGADDDVDEEGLVRAPALVGGGRGHV